MTTKHILFISYDGMTDPLGQSQVIPYLAGLSANGYRFTILSCDKRARYDANKDYVHKLLQPYPINWISVPYTKNPPVLSSLYDVRKLKQKARLLYKTDAFDMVHTRPGIPTIVALSLVKEFKVKFFNDVRGFWADERVDGGMWNLKNPVYKRIYKFFKDHEYECLQTADHTTCLTYNAKREMQSWKNIPNQPVPIEVIPCSVDLELFKTSSVDFTLAESFRKKFGIRETDTVVSYLGSLGGWYLTNEMMQFAKVLSVKKPEIKFLFISPHPREEVLNAAAKAGLEEKFIITCYGKRHEIPALLSLSHFSFFFIKKCYSKISSSPTKHGELMAMGIPVVTNKGVGDVDAIIQKYDAGVLLDEFSTEGYQKAADAILDKKFDKAIIRKGAEEFYALENAVNTYLKVYRKIFKD